MADRSVSVRLAANVGGFVTGIRTAQKATEDFVGKGLDKVAARSSALNQVSMTAGVMGAGLVAAAGAAVNAFAGFDQAMSNVQASTMESADNMELLREAALDAGARTVFSASEAAGAIEELAKAGVSTADILNGGLDGALDLAAAGGIAVAEAAETAASAMTQFGLAGDDVTHIADLLAAGAGKAQGGVSDLGAALNQSGLVASQMGLSIEETVGSLTAFASAGLIGSDAGTSFRAMLLRLANPTKESRDLMEDLGLRVYDTSGEFVGMEALAGGLQSALGGLTQEQRNFALAQLFGQDAIRTSSILFEEGATGVREWTTAVDEAGYAAEVAAMRMDNLRGDWEEFTGSLETALIGAGEGADGPLRSLVQSATDAVNAFSNLPPAVQQGTVAIAGAGGLALLGVAGLAKLVTTAADVKQSLTAIGVSAKTAGIAVGGITAGLAVVTVGVAAFASAQAEAEAKVRSLADTLDEQTGALTENSTAWIQSELTKDQSFGILNTKSMAEAAEEMGISLETLTRAYEGQPEAIEAARSSAQGYLDQQNLLNDTWLASSSVAQIFLENLDDQSARLETARGIQETKLAIDGAASAQQGEMAAAYDSTTVSVEDQTEAVGDLIDSLSTLAGNVLSARDAERQLEDSIANLDTVMAENGKTMDITTEKGRANQAALDDVAASSWDVIDAMAANGASATELQGKMATLRTRFITAATAALGNAGAAEALANELGLIPENVNTHVSTTGVDQAIGAAATLRQVIDGIPRNVNVAFNGSVSGSLYSASSAANSLVRTPGLATGGFVAGPGTATSDSIPARLSNGEYVVKADSVAKYGRSFFDAVNAQKFAGGGYVGGGAVNVAAPSLDGLSISGRLEMGTDGFVSLVDGRIEQSRRAVAMAGRPA